MRLYIPLFCLLILLPNCVLFEKKTKTANSEIKNEIQLPQINCSPEPMRISLAYYHNDLNKSWKKTVNLPLKGLFVEESHYVTTEDKFPQNRLFANQPDENMEEHLQRSFLLYKKYDPNAKFGELYGKNWQKQWTPAESGKIGQGSVGDVQVKELRPEMELWLLTMMWDKGQKPKKGTKFILKANDKAVVVIAGYETGPSSKNYLGGVTTEVHRWLGTDNQSEIELIYPKEQNIAPGPVICR